MDGPPSKDDPPAQASLPATPQSHISGSIKLVTVFFTAMCKLYINTVVLFLIVSTLRIYMKPLIPDSSYRTQHIVNIFTDRNY